MAMQIIRKWKRMGKRLASNARREQILEGATRLFAEKGFRGTKTREIAQELSISEALVYRHFPSKEALYRAIIEKRIHGSEEILFPRKAVQAKDDHEVFRNIALHLIRKNTADPTFLRLVLFSALEGNELSRIFFDTYALANLRVLADYISQRVDEKAFRKVDPLLAARAFLGMVMHHIIARTIYGAKTSRDASSEGTADALVDFFLSGLEEKRASCEREENAPSPRRKPRRQKMAEPAGAAPEV